MVASMAHNSCKIGASRYARIQEFKGKAGVMPAKGGNTSLSDEQVKAAVDYMMAAAR